MKKATAKKILQSVKESYNSIANEFSDTRQYSWKEFDFFKPYLHERAEIVDIGCGNGRLIKFLDQFYLGKPYRYIGLDNSNNLLQKAHQSFPNRLFLPGDQLSIPVDENEIDIIFNIAAFHHIPSYKLRLEALMGMHRILKKDGKLIITVWNLWQYKYLKENIKGWSNWLFSFGQFAPNDLFISFKNGKGTNLANRYYHNFFPFEIKYLAKKAGFKVLEKYSCRKGKKCSFLQGHNYVLILQKDEK